MFYRSSAITPTQRRPGVVLLVVMAMLALFASLALSFVFYADSEAESSQQSVSALNRDVPDVDPEALLDFFLSKFIYPDNDPYSAGRGQSLSESMYGYNPFFLNYTPFNGGGRATYAPTTTPDPDLGVPMFNMINNQMFWDPSQPATNKTVNFARTPEFYGKAHFASGTPPVNSYAVPGAPATYRFVGGANPPWTAYDSNSLFLAEMTADGNVLLPSFKRPWLQAPPGSPAAKYTSVFPDPSWNPAFFPLPDMDASGNQVRNLDVGPGMNDSNWMDWGYPIMTSTDGKRYKALFAPLIVDLSNRLHLWAHGNNLGTLQPGGQMSVSNQGFGAPEVNLTMLPGTVITRAVEKGGVVTVGTSVPHGLKAGKSFVIIRNMPPNLIGYNGMYLVTSTPAPTAFTYTDATKGLPPYTGNAIPAPTVLSVDEMQALFNLRYAPQLPLTLPTFPVSWASGTPPMSAKGAWYSKVNASALDPLADVGSPTLGMSSLSPTMMAFQTKTAAAAGPGAAPVKFLPYPGLQPFPWAIESGMNLTIDAGTPNQEMVKVTKVNYAVNPPTFTAPLAKKHAAGAVISGGYPGFPTFPLSWGNASVAELTPNPLAFNLYLPNAPSLAPHQEALSRWGGTNGPALPSSIFQLMPTTFSNIRARNMVTPVNWNLDRVMSAPYLNFDAVKNPQYGYYSGGYPLVGINEVQAVTVVGTPNQTFTLTFHGQTTNPALPIGSSAAVVQAALQNLPTIGKGNVSVYLNPPGVPPVTHYSYTVTFMGTLGNTKLPLLVGAPPANVMVAAAQVGQPLFSAPNFAATPIQTPTTNSDFSGDWRSAVSQILRVDLTRPLTDYPPPLGTGLINPASPQYLRAVSDRQQFATDLYHALVRVTGAPRSERLDQGPTRHDHEQFAGLSGGPLARAARGQHRRLHRRR